ncbi:hypothetical protein Bca52824_023375 [Brassica carinata]|uniref:Uncharacterized protein n=1 Tax=Brassica carinata TaxID=52824 RepID=A0A8X7VIK2_BRACI|nr:hypothetical protein Bca52824_023375 [Brassica carinata]
MRETQSQHPWHNQWESLLCILSSAAKKKDSIYKVNNKIIAKYMGFFVVTWMQEEVDSNKTQVFFSAFGQGRRLEKRRNMLYEDSA